jgi:large subunit ribosomal protein L10
MALTKEKKVEVISEAKDLISSSKLTVLASYSGISVKAMQSLRANSAENNTTIRVIKNRLFKKAASQNDNWKSNFTGDFLTGQVLYAFNPDDEVSPAKVLAEFSKTNPTLEFIGAITQDGTFIGPDDVKSLASLPSKDQLRAQLVGTIAAPLTGFINVMNGSLRGVINVLNARSESIS